MNDKKYKTLLVILVSVLAFSLFFNGWLAYKRFSGKIVPLALRLCQTNADCKKLGADLYCNPVELGVCKTR